MPCASYMLDESSPILALFPSPTAFEKEYERKQIDQVREDDPSQPPAGDHAAVFRHPPQRAVPSRNALPKCIHALRAKPRKTSLLRDSVPGARKRHPNLPRCACADLACGRPPLCSGCGTPPLALAAPAGVGQGQGVFVSKHSTAIQKRRKHP
jgi:hypothetical protein